MKKLTVLTFLMLNLFSVPAFSETPENTAELNFAPVDAAVYTPARARRGSSQEVLFYIPVYTMTVYNKKEAAAPATGAAGVVMPFFNQSDYKKVSNAAPQPQTPPQSGSVPQIPDKTPDNSGSVPDIPSVEPDIPSVEPDIPSIPGISNKPQNPESAGSLSNAPSDYEKSKNITAAAPIAILPAAIFKKGAKLKVRSLDEVTSKDKIYKKVEFVTVEPVVTTYSTIPIGTLVRAEIQEIKEPQKMGGGAMVSLKAEKLFFDDEIRSIEGVVTKTEDKKVRFNRIKGARTYLKEMVAYSNTGKENYKKSLEKSKKYAKSPKTFLISPFPVIGGAFGALGRYAAAPFYSLKKKGEEVKIAEGSYYELKLTSDLKVEDSNDVQACAL